MCVCVCGEGGGGRDLKKISVKAVSDDLERVNLSSESGKFLLLKNFKKTINLQ